MRRKIAEEEIPAYCNFWNTTYIQRQLFSNNKGALFYSLKGLSGRIKSAWEWCHWKGLDKDINRYMFGFLNLILNIWKFWAASYENDSNLLLLWHTVCIESFLPIGWRTFIWWKNRRPIKWYLFYADLIWLDDTFKTFINHVRRSCIYEGTPLVRSEQKQTTGLLYCTVYEEI